MTVPLALTLLEWWAVRDFTRRHQEYGCVWDRETMVAVHRAILHLNTHREQSTYSVEVSAEFLWLIEQQVPDGFMVGQTLVGRETLLKVMAALEALRLAAESPVSEADEARGTMVPEAVQRPFVADDVALQEFERYWEQRKKE